MESYQAIKKGVLWVTVSALAFMLGGLALGVYLSVGLKLMHPAYIALFFVGSLIVYAPFWSILTSQWKLWSLQKVEDVDILIHMAYNRHLMYPEHHFYSRYELSTQAHKQRVKQLIERRQRENHLDRYIETYKGEEITVTSSSFFQKGEGIRLSFNFKGIKFQGEKRIKWSKLSYVKTKIRSGSKYSPPKLWIHYKNADGHTYVCKVGPVNSLNYNVHKLEYLLAVYEKVGRSKSK